MLRGDWIGEAAAGGQTIGCVASFLPALGPLARWRPFACCDAGGAATLERERCLHAAQFPQQPLGKCVWLTISAGSRVESGQAPRWGRTRRGATATFFPGKNATSRPSSCRLSMVMGIYSIRQDLKSH